MRNRILFLAASLFIVVFSLWYFRWNPKTQPPVLLDGQTINPSVQITPSHAEPSAIPKNNSRASAEQLRKFQSQMQSRTDTEVYKEIGTDFRHLDPLYDTPVDFYGKVIDEKLNPVADADVIVSVADRSSEGASRTSMKTDTDGMFSLTEKKGIGVLIFISKEGYYTPREQNYSFGYVEGLRPVFYRPNPSSPVVFTLKKKGGAESLICNSKLFGFNPDGTYFFVDLVNGKKTSGNLSGDIEIRFLRGSMDANRRFDWSLSIMPINGGIVESTEEFMFLAPEEGYQPKIEISGQSRGNETTMLRKLYLKSRGGKCYARIELTIFPKYNDTAAIDFNYCLNTNGSRNLEYHESKQPPKQIVFE